MSERGRPAASGVELATVLGPLRLVAPVLTAAGTSGHGAELAAYLELASLGAVVVKSLAAFAWPGNPAPRVVGVSAGMLNSVGLQGPGIEAWLEHDLPRLAREGAAVVVSIWGRTPEEFAAAAAMLKGADPCVIAVEVNVSCPNLHGSSRRAARSPAVTPMGAPAAPSRAMGATVPMFAHSASATADAVAAAAICRLPCFAKLSPAVTDLVEIAAGAIAGGATGLVLTNTMAAMSISLVTRRPSLAAGGGGLSGAALHPIAVRAVWDCHEAFPGVPIVGAGGVSSGEDAIELLLAGASAVQVGTATFAEPRAPARVLAEVASWCEEHGVASVAELVGAAHG
ncbi:MAG TPA: dihydroorotate dehydrogenase [Acidimicrobiales bacterium]|nr:dihydroorotate dehydrogenase [Acidimicrobiales bacterium]